MLFIGRNEAHISFLDAAGEYVVTIQKQLNVFIIVYDIP